jgi:hypothetical protein
MIGESIQVRRLSVSRKLSNLAGKTGEATKGKLKKVNTGLVKLKGLKHEWKGGWKGISRALAKGVNLTPLIKINALSVAGQDNGAARISTRIGQSYDLTISDAKTARDLVRVFGEFAAKCVDGSDDLFKPGTNVWAVNQAFSDGTRLRGLPTSCREDSAFNGVFLSNDARAVILAPHYEQHENEFQECREFVLVEGTFGQGWIRRSNLTTRPRLVGAGGGEVDLLLLPRRSLARTLTISITMLLLLMLSMGGLLSMIELPVEKEERLILLQSFNSTRSLLLFGMFDFTATRAQGGQCDSASNSNSVSCSSCFPDPVSNGFMYNSSTPRLDLAESDAHTYTTIECPLMLPSVAQVEVCRLSAGAGANGYFRYNQSCLVNRLDCPNCNRLAGHVSTGTASRIMVEVDVAALYLIHKVVYESIEPETSKPYNWDLRGSIFFAMTVISTVGYGNFAPTQAWSKLLLALLGLPGMALFGYTIANVAKLTMVVVAHLEVMVSIWTCRKIGNMPTRELLANKCAVIINSFNDNRDSGSFSKFELNLCLIQLKEIFDSASATFEAGSKLLLNQLYINATKNDRGEVDMEQALVILQSVANRRMQHFNEERAEQQVHLMLALAVFSIFVASLVFWQLESGIDAEAPWTFLDAVYFSVITTTTTGLGDLVPNIRNDFTIVFWFVFVTWGLGLVASVIQKVQTMGSSGLVGRRIQFVSQLRYFLLRTKRPPRKDESILEISSKSIHPTTDPGSDLTTVHPMTTKGELLSIKAKPAGGAAASGGAGPLFNASQLAAMGTSRRLRAVQPQVWGPNQGSKPSSFQRKKHRGSSAFLTC